MFARLEKITGIATSCLLFLLMLLTFVDVFGRNVLNHPLTGASEVTELMLAGIIFLMLPQVAFRQKHIVIDLIDAITSPGLRGIMNVAAALLSAAMFFLIGWQIYILGQKAIGYADATPSLHIPVGPILYFLAFLAIMNGIAFLLTIPKAFEVPEPKSETEELSFTV